MITEKQLKLFEVFAKNPFVEHTRKEIKKTSKEKSNNTLALAINLLKKEGVVLERKIGKSGVLTLNLDNDVTFYYISLCNINRMHHLAKLVLDAIKKEITEHTPFYSLVIFGSYAINEQKKDSDIDVAIFIESEEKKKQIEGAINSAKLKNPLETDVHIITKNEMLEMLADKKENLGKQIVRKHLALYNHRIFYEIIKEGMNHGFRI